MSNSTYNASQRGKLVKVAAGSSNRVYLGPQAAQKSAEFIDGPKTVGTATGFVYTEGTRSFQEVLRSAYNPFLPTAIETIYLIATDIELATNPDYDPAKDTDRPTDEPDATTGPVDGNDAELDVSTTPGAGRVPVKAADGKTVYVLVRNQAGSTTTVVDNSRKWLTYGLYGVLGLAVVALLVIVLRKPKPQQKLLPA